MAKSLHEQMLQKGLVAKAETPAARRAAARAARPPETEKELPPLFEARATGVIVPSRNRPSAARSCSDCGAALPPSQRVTAAVLRCAECAAQP